MLETELVVGHAGVPESDLGLVASRLEGEADHRLHTPGRFRDPGVLDAAVSALRSGGRLVVNAVTLATEGTLLARHAAMGGELVKIAVARAAPLDRSPDSRSPMAWRPALPVTQWTWVKT